MLDLNWSDVVSTIQSLQSYLIAIGVIFALAIIATFACMKLAKHQKFMIRCQAWIAALIAIAVVVNIICTGPMYTLLSLVSGTGTLTQETSDAAVLRVEDSAGAGARGSACRTSCKGGRSIFPGARGCQGSGK